MKQALVALLIALPALAQDYRFETIKRKVLLNETPIAAGQAAKGGDAVETGWFSYALIAAEHSRAKFEIFSATEVKLAGGTPGVILSLERGRIRAAFDKITGSEPRVVQTPGALLAVRGTQFDVRVDREGETTVDVWEGVVEVQSPLRPEPVFVRAGEESIFGRTRPPAVQPMPEHRRQQDPNRPRDDRGGARQPGDRNPEPRGRDGGMGGHHGGTPPSTTPPPTPPPPRKPPE